MPGRRPHPLLFCLAAGALLASAAALWIGDRDPEPLPHRARPPSTPTSATGLRLKRAAAEEDQPLRGRVGARFRAARLGIAAAARRFLGAFSHYELGQLTPSVAAALGAGATEEFAAQLLASPPRLPPSRPPPRATLLWLEVLPLARAAPEALVSGALLRGGSVEPFCFRFKREGGRWLASGVGE